MRSAKKNELSVKVLGMGEEWKGGDMTNSVGGGQKVLMMRQALESYKDDPEMMILFTDAYDVLFNANRQQIVEQFNKFDARVVFSAEGFCWPDAHLASEYPEVERGKRYLNSGLFMGYAPELWQILNSAEIANNDDDQRFYTKVYLDSEKHGKEYESVKLIRDSDNIKEWHARNLGIEECVKTKCEYYFNLDSVAHIDNPHALKLLVEQNRPIVAPLMIRPYQAWSNFWGSLTSDGFYARS